jgi:hypothetical protein
MGFLDWFERKANARLRKSQIKMVYQNEAAVDHLISEFGNMQEAGMQPDPNIVETLNIFQAFTDDCIIRLTWNTCLPDPASAQMLDVNNGLKNVYNGLLDGSRKFRSSMGLAAGDLVPFASRFSPASGWERISDNEWDPLVKKALSRLPKSDI